MRRMNRPRKIGRKPSGRKNWLSLRKLPNSNGEIMADIIHYGGRKSCGDGFESSNTMCEENSNGVWECTGENVQEGGGCPDAPGY